MNETNQCPECGAELPSSAPRGLCPACLLKRGLEINTVAPTAEPAASGRWTPPTVEELSSRFPELDITRLIGRGGMGAVYQAGQKNLDRVVALKILPPEMGGASANGGFADRFAREAQAMARLYHPHIVTIHEFGQRDGLYYFLMEYVDGMSLRQLLDSGHVSPREALAIVPQICEALQYAHDHGIVHRDIKPENILLNKQGQVKIADFGLAKLMGRGAGGAPAQAAAGSGQDIRGQDVHATQNVIGTPQYMAPEQLDRPAEVDHRADIYSLGVVFYQLLTGELPKGQFEPPSHKVRIDVRLDEVVLRALEKEPSLRYQQASEVKTQVETIVSTPGVTSGTDAASHSSTGVPPVGTRLRGASVPPAIPYDLPSSPHFSRTAIIGAILLLIPLLASGFHFLVKIVSPGVKPWETSVLMFWEVALALVGIAAIVATTLLGWIAVSQIRHSPGRLYGLGLAVFDGLFFPVFALDGLIFWVGRDLYLGVPEATLICMLVNALLMRLVWRAVNKPLNGSNTLQTARPESPVMTSQRRSLSILPTIIFHLIAVLIVLGFFMLAVPRYAGIFTDLKVPLPPITDITLRISRALIDWWPLVIPAVLLFLAADAGVCGLLNRTGSRPIRWIWSAAVLVTLGTVFAMAIAGVNATTLSLIMQIKPPQKPSAGVQLPDPNRPKTPDGKADVIPLGFLPLNTVTQRTIYDDGVGRDFIIDFDTGKLYTLTEEDKKAGIKPQDLWNRGFDAGAETAVRGPGLYCGDMIVIPLANERWENVTLGGLRDDIAAGKPGTPVVMSALAPLPRSYLFKTREESIGALQILEMMDKPPRHIKVRYKLLEYGSAPGAVQSSTAIADPQAAVGMLAPLQGIYVAVRTALFDQNDPKTAIALLDQAIPQMEKFLEMLKGTDAEPGIGAAIQQIRDVRQALKEGKINQAKALLEGINNAGPMLAELVRKSAAMKIGVPQPATISRLQFRRVGDADDNAETEEMIEPNGNTKIRVLKQVEMDENSIARAKAIAGQSGGWQVMIEFTPDGSERFEKLTGDSIGRRLAFVLDGQVLSAPTVRSVISKSGVISSNGLTEAQARKIAATIDTIRPRIWRGLDLRKGRFSQSEADFPEIFEERPPGSKSFDFRQEMIVYREENDIHAAAFWMPGQKRFYVQYEEDVASRPLHFYGPFEGDPIQILKIDPAWIQKSGPRPTTTTQPATQPTRTNRISPEQVAVEDLALEMLVAIREKDDAKLQAMSVDQVKGWRESLPHFAMEMRERFTQMTGKPFTLYPGQSLVQGDRAVVKCTAKELGDVYLVLFFVKTDVGWRNWSLRNSPASAPLSEYLRIDPAAPRAADLER